MTLVQNETQQHSAALKNAGQNPVRLLPLDRRGRLGRDVVAHAVGAGDLGHNATTDAGQDVVGKLGPVGGHGIAGLDGAQDDRALVGALVSHDADGLDVRQHRKVLPAGVLGVALAGLLEEALVVGVKLLAHDGVGALQDLQLLLVHRTDDADGQAGAGERLAEDDVLGQAKGQTQRADLVLEEVVKRLDEVKAHALGEGDEVVMALDGGRLATRLARAGLDDVRVDGALGQELHRLAIGLQLLGNGEELLPELRADDAALLLGLGHAGEKLGVAVLGVDVDEVDVKLLGEDLLDLLGLVLAQQAVVDEDAGHLLADAFSRPLASIRTTSQLRVRTIAIFCEFSVGT